MNMLDGIAHVILKAFTYEPDHPPPIWYESPAPPPYERLAPPSYLAAEVGRATQIFLRRLGAIENVAIIVGAESSYLKVEACSKAIALDAAADRPGNLKNGLRNLQKFSSSLFKSTHNSLTASKIREAEIARLQIAHLIENHLE